MWKRKADIAEEIARFYGYNKIPTTIIRGEAAAQLTPRQKFERKLNELLLAQGMNEIVTFSFISPKYYDKIGLPADSPGASIRWRSSTPWARIPV